MEDKKQDDEKEKKVSEVSFKEFTEEKKPKIRFAGFTDDWKQCKLGDITNIIDPHPSHRAPAAVSEGIPFIGIGDVDPMGYIDESSARKVDEQIYEEHHKRYDLNIPSLGIGRVASLGKVIRLRNDIGKYAISPTMSIIQPQKEVTINYLYSCMESPIFQKQFSSQSNGSTRQSVGIQDLRALYIYIPCNMKEQELIGEYFYNLDKFIILYHRKCNKLKEVKKYMLQKMFPKNGETKPEIRFKGFTDDWKQRKLSDLADRYDNLRVPVSASERIHGSTPYYGANGIQDYVEGYTHDGEFILIAEDGANDLKNYPVQYTTGKIWVNNHAHVLQGKVNIADNKFLGYSINATNIESFLVGGGRAKLNAEVMMSIELLVPSYPEQCKISVFFYNLDNLIRLHQRKCDKLKEVKKYMLQNMFPRMS